MASLSDALFPLLIEDLRPHLSVDQEIAAYIGGSIPSYPDESVEQVAARSLLSNVFKKLVTAKSPDADACALDKFVESNRLCEKWCWSRASWDLKDDLLVGTFKSVVWDVFSDSRLCFSSLNSLSPNGALGSGANIHSNGTDLYSKLYSSRLSCSTPAIFDLYQRYVSNNDRCRNAEFIRTLHYGHNIDVSDSKLSFVPKSNAISRTICTEPTLNMWYQRAYSSQIEECLKSYFGIDLSTQPDVNRELSRLGSRDDSFATIDLASASDSISLKLLEDVLPKEVLSILKFFRCPKTRLPNGSCVELQMVSSMGNGFTFSLQTILFCCMVKAVYDVLGIAILKNKVSFTDGVYVRKRVIIGNFAVFGDDIIIEKVAYPFMCRLLELCGFRVNAAKSFAIGPFRESCGADFHNGINVRPVFIKTLDTLQARYTAINLLRYWSSRLRIPLSKSFAFLAKTVKWVPVPRSAPVEAGLHVPLVALPRVARDSNGAILYKSFVPKDLRYTVKGESVVGPRFAKKKIFNPDGLILYALAGGIRNGSFSVRLTDLRYRLVDNITPNWDDKPRGVDPLDQSGWARWDSESLVFSQHYKP